MVELKHKSYILFIQWWQMCALGLSFVVIGIATEIFVKSLFARVAGAVAIIVGLALFVYGIMLYLASPH